MEFTTPCPPKFGFYGLKQACYPGTLGRCYRCDSINREIQEIDRLEEPLQAITMTAQVSIGRHMLH